MMAKQGLGGTESYIGDIQAVFLQDIGIPATDTNLQQFDVMCRSMKIFNERNEARGDLWADFDIHDAIHHAKSKLARVMAIAEKIERLKAARDPYSHLNPELMDDALDLINFSDFIVRHLFGWLGKGEGR